jgi:hypothetical protein
MATMVVIVLMLVCLPVVKGYGAVQAYDPAPPNGAGSVSLQPVFSWKFDGDSCNVYGGISPDDLRLVISDTTTTSVQAPQMLPPETVFYWQVDVNSGDQVIKGDVWTFRTESLADSAGCSSFSPNMFLILLSIPLALLVFHRH